MSELLKKIHAAQVRAGEDAVMESLYEQGIMPRPAAPLPAIPLAELRTPQDFIGAIELLQRAAKEGPLHSNTRNDRFRVIMAGLDYVVEALKRVEQPL